MDKAEAANLLLQNKIRRRAFLKMAGGGLLALPFLESLTSSKLGLASLGSGLANTAAITPKRLICIYSGNGQYAPHWYPNSGLLRPRLDLKTIPGDLSTVFGSGFNSLKGKISLLRGLDYMQLRVDDHWGGKAFSGFGQTYNRSATIDQIVAKSKKVYPVEPFLRSLFLMPSGCLVGSGRLETGVYSYARNGGTTSPITPILSPRVAFEKLFPKTTVSDEFVTDQVRAQYQLLSKNSRLSELDRKRLDLHISLLDDLERRLPAPSLQCPNSSSIALPDNELDYRAQLKCNFDIALAAVRCDLTRVVRVNMTHSAEMREYSFLPGVSKMNFHGLTHEYTDDAARQLAIIQNFHATAVAEFLNGLNEVEEPDTGRTYLDNSIVFWGNEVGTQPVLDVANIHDSLDLPVFLAGDCKGFFQTGLYVDYRRPGVYKKWNNAQCNAEICEMDAKHSTLGRPYNELLITLMQAMGLEPSEWEEGDSPGFGDYGGDEFGQYDVGNRRSTLPGILS